MSDFIERDAQEVFEEEFLAFAGYNIQRRALPDVRDGLKWGGRKLLHAQMLGRLTHDKPFKKALKSVAQATSFSFTHGDASAYATFIRMAKPFAMNVPLQEAKGNYGTLISPDDYSASRYVEMRGSEAAAYLLKDLDKDTITEWEDTYDMEGQFPKVLPAKGFWGLVNGCISIGSGMSCSVAPMNLVELNDALIKLLWDSNAPDEEIIVMPDFPTGATILNRNEVFESLKNGSGAACKVRASIEYDPKERCLMVKELPYSTYTNTICNELATIITEDEDCGIANFVDFTGEKPDLRIYLAKKASPDKVLQRLYKETSLQTYYTINMMMLNKGITPKQFGLREAMQAHLDHEVEVYTRGFKYDIKKWKARAHILKGLMMAYDAIDEVIHTIKASASNATANKALCELLSIDEDQAKAILDLKLSRLSKIDINKLRQEYEDLNASIQRVTAILNDETLLKKEIENGLREVAHKFGKPRRTQILNIEAETDEPVEICQLQVSLTNCGNIYTVETSSLYTQRRGGVGNKLKLSRGEYVISTQLIKSDEELLLFSNVGNIYHCRASELQLDQFASIYQLAPIKEEEQLCAFTSTSKQNAKPYILFFTKNGLVKKSALSEYNITRNIGFKALALDEGDEIVSVVFTDKDKVAVATELGNFLIFATDIIRPIGRVARGVKAITLNADDHVINARTIPNLTTSIVSISGEGLFKKTSFDEFAPQGRATKGAKIQRLNEGDWLADFYPITNEDEILVASTRSCIKLKIDDIPSLSKGAMGNKSIKLAPTENVIKISAC